MNNTVNYSDADKVAADYELSERLGREILEAGCEPLPSSPVKVRWCYSTVRRFSCMGGVIRIVETTVKEAF